MAKIVYNRCYGGFGLSEEALELYKKIKGSTADIYAWDIVRTDPVLVQVIEQLGEKANGNFADLAIAEVSEGTRYRIDEYDGSESVMTMDDYNWEIA